MALNGHADAITIHPLSGDERTWPGSPLITPPRAESWHLPSTTREASLLPAAQAREILRHGFQHGAPVRDGMMKLLEHQVEGRKIAFVHRAVVVADQDFTQDAVDLVLHVL